jgi:hypothetical protein
VIFRLLKMVPSRYAMALWATAKKWARVSYLPFSWPGTPYLISLSKRNMLELVVVTHAQNSTRRTCASTPTLLTECGRILENGARR